MTNSEFSNEFDVLYNNIMSNAAPGLNEYEKSVFLTKAQDEIIKNYFNPKGNKYQEGFDDNQKRQVDFSSLIVSRELVYNKLNTEQQFDSRSYTFLFPSDLFIVINEQLRAGNNIHTVVPINYMEYDRLMSKPYKYPIKNHAWRILTKNIPINTTTDTVSATNSKYNISFVTVSSYGKPVRMIVSVGGYSSNMILEHPPVVIEEDNLVTITMSIPNDAPSSLYWNAFLLNGTGAANVVDLSPYIGKFTGGLEDSVWPSFRPSEENGTVLIDITNPGGKKERIATVAEIIGRFNSTPTYKVRYLKRPNPIILDNLPNELSISGIKTITDCELPEELHGEILQRAVELAKAAYTGDLNSQVALGVNSQTNLGMVASK